MTQEEFFKRYTYDVVEDRIGGGGFGTVYKAYDNVLHHEVAIKVAAVKTMANGKTFSLKDEVNALSGLPDHPNIAYYEKEKLYTFKTPTGVCDFAVMQYYPDGNLNDAIKQGLTAEQKEDIATQLLKGIDFLHKHKVVHRDLKPSNILIVRHGGKMIPLITDFGLSKATSVVDGSVFSNSFGAGTPKYSSPEQLQGQSLRFNTDLWSYGAILYELFTGTQLFSAGSGAANTAQADLEIYNKIVNGNIQSLSKIPEKWRKVAERCLVVDATMRAKDAVDLFGVIKGDVDDDETEVTVYPSQVHNPVNRRDTRDKRDTSSKPLVNTIPKQKGIAIPVIPVLLGVVAVVIAIMVLLSFRKELNDPDLQAFQACRTVDDYRAYINDYYGHNAKHYVEAKAFIDQYVADSTEQALQAQQRIEYEKKEDAAYKRCTTVAACNKYLKTYPNGRYVEEVEAKKSELENKKIPSMLANENTSMLMPAQIDNNNESLFVNTQQNKEQNMGEIHQIENSSSISHDYMDLGLPSGTLWATCNLGASKPEDYGNYYAWGETKTKAVYGSETYKYANSDDGLLTKYCNNSDYGSNDFADNLITLQIGDDPAVAWGRGWHTPSKVQWEELLQNTTSKTTTRNGVEGRLFTAKNGNAVFLPRAGYREGDKLIEPGFFGYYWSRSLYTKNPEEAWNLSFFLYNECEIDGDFREKGFSVRPVREK